MIITLVIGRRVIELLGYEVDAFLSSVAENKKVYDMENVKWKPTCLGWLFKVGDASRDDAEGDSHDDGDATPSLDKNKKKSKSYITLC